jgi:cation:H+ antiporter
VFSKDQSDILDACNRNIVSSVNQVFATMSIIGFVFCAALITFSGTQLSKQGDRLAELTGLSKAWIGLVLMATVTSLPELVTGLSSVVIVKAPDLATGNVLGSCAFNLLILSLLDLFVKKPITSLVQTSHIVSGAFSIILLAIAGAAIAFDFDFFRLLWISPLSIVLIIVYVIAMRAVFLYEKTHPAELEKADSRSERNSNSIRKALGVYSLHALVVVFAALFLPYFGENIADRFGITETFFGTVFLAITTSLPEVVVSISALRLGALDMAMGNLLGSNVFNIAILALLDFFYISGPLYPAVSGSHTFSIFSSIVMTAIVALGLVIRPDKKRWHLSLDGWLILIIYLINILLLR